jgi:hypothetical protein
MIETDEQLVMGVVIRVLKPVKMPERYKTMFHGHTDLKPSFYIWWYPIKNVEYARLIHEVERWYKGKIRIIYGIAGSAEV